MFNLLLRSVHTGTYPGRHTTERERLGGQYRFWRLKIPLRCQSATTNLTNSYHTVFILMQDGTSELQYGTQTILEVMIMNSFGIFATAFLLISIQPKSESYLLVKHPFQKKHVKNFTTIKMGWSDTWNDILSGGNQRWKVTDSKSHEKAFSHFQTHVESNPSETSVLCPLAGDDPFVHLLFQKGFSVTTIDLVPAAVEALKEQFGECSWTKEESSSDSSVTWKHESGRATLIVGDALQKRPQLVGKFDAVYDKDSFGAIDKQIRNTFCKRMAEFTKQGAVIYLECKVRENHDEAKNLGPPFSLKKDDLMEVSNYGECFEYVQGLGTVYEITMPMEQTGHILVRK